MIILLKFNYDKIFLMMGIAYLTGFILFRLAIGVNWI